jgi:hypothetical protein
MRIALAGVLAFVGAVHAADLPPSTTAATQQYEAAIAKAKAEYEAKEKAARQTYVLRLQEAALAEGQKGNLDGAMAIKGRMGELAGSDSEIRPGAYRIKYGVFTLGRDDQGRWNLREGEKNRSLDSAVIDGKIIFRWTNANALMVVEKDGSRGIAILCYSQRAKDGALPRELPDGAPDWRHVGQVEK